MSNDTTAKTGGPAFPTPQRGYDREGNIETVQMPGMSLRDYFAAKAMQGMLTGTLGRLSEGAEVSAYATGHCNAAVAERAYCVADAMLKAREVRRG